MSTGGSRASIPSSVRKTIQNIKEIARNHSDEEIYAMLKECSMDPNDTAQKLLYQDTFHEVKRKRDKRKENQNNKDTAESRWRSGMQGQVGRVGRGNQSPRYVNHDAGGGRNASIRKENGINVLLERGVLSSHVPASKDVGTKAPTHLASSGTSMTNVSSNVAHGSTTVPCVSGLQAGIDTNFPEAPSSVTMNKLETASRLPPPVNAKITPPGVSLKQELSTSNSENLASPVSVLGVSSSVSDHVLVPSLDSWLPGTVGTMKHDVGGQWGAVESNSMTSVECKSANSQDFVNQAQISKSASENVTELSSSMTEKAASEVGDSFMHGKMPGKSLGIERNRLVDTAQIQFTSIHGGNMSGRPPSNYSSRSQQLIVSQKAVGLSKEWKPKPVNPNSVPSSGTVGLSDTASIAAEADSHSQPASAASASEEETLKIQTRLEELHFSDNQQVIIPNHLQVPEAERTGLSFGSFDASFGMSTTYAGGADTEKSSTPASESSHMLEESIEEPCSSQVASPTDQEGDYHDHLQSPTKVQENMSTVETDGPSNAVPEYDQTKLESVLPVGGPQYSVVHTTPNYSTFGLMPPILGTQFAPFDSSEPQARDVSRIPSFIVQQRFDPSSSFFPQFYRPSAEGDGRFSPFLAPAAAAKYNGNVAVVSPHSGQSPQEGGNSLVISTASPTPLVTQAAGVVQNSIGVTQQSLPVFRQPAGVHLPHYPPNYMPYSQYLSPFYVPPPAIHQFLSSTSFPQQPPSGNIYPPSAAGATAAAGVKYPMSQYKPGNTGSSTHVAMPTSYAPYSSSPAGYGPSPAPTTDNSTGNEDLSASQYKENNVYITGQQSEGSTVWIPALGREISGLQTNSFYNLSPQGQHVAYTPAQAGHGALTGIYHPAQTVAAATVHPLLQQSQTMAGAVEMVGPPSGVYQQPQHAQINWTNNY